MSIIRIGDRIKISKCIENGIYKTHDEMYGTLLGKPYSAENRIMPYSQIYKFYVIWPDEKYDGPYKPFENINLTYMHKQIKTLVNERKLLLLPHDKKDLISFSISKDKIPRIRVGDMACWRNSYFYFFGKISFIYNKQYQQTYNIERALCMDFKDIHDYIKYIDRKVIDYIPLKNQEIEIQEEKEIVKKKRFSLDKILINEEVLS